MYCSEPNSHVHALPIYCNCSQGYRKTIAHYDFDAVVR